MSRERCLTCTLPAVFPGARIDEDGVCAFCRSGPSAEALDEEKVRLRERFEALLERHRGRAAYDCLVSFSGGKDSSYTMAILRERYGLRVLAVTVDNGFLSPMAERNILRVTEALAVDHMTFRIRFDLLRRLFAAGAEREMFPRKSLERASTICTCCITLVKAIALRTALEKGIPLMAYGWSPGQAPLKASIMQPRGPFLKSTQDVARQALVAAVGEDVNAYFPESRFFEPGASLPTYVHPLAFLDYDEEAIIRHISSLGWERPADTDPNSTNCLLNAFSNQIHEERYGYNPYAFEIAKMVREGHLNHDEALAKFSDVRDEAGIRRVRERLGLS